MVRNNGSVSVNAREAKRNSAGERMQAKNHQLKPTERPEIAHTDPNTTNVQAFATALDLHMREHKDTSQSLVAAVLGNRDKPKMAILRDWRAGRVVPRHKGSLEFLEKIERHYLLPEYYFAKLITKSNPTFKRSSRKLNAFQAALNFEMRKHRDSSPSLAAALARAGETDKARMITSWKTGKNMPRHRMSFLFLQRIELHYQLPMGYLADLIAQPQSATRRALKQIAPSNRSVFRWHLPADFEQRTIAEQNEIVAWISFNVMGCATEYGRYQSSATRYGYSVVFPTLDRSRGGRWPKGEFVRRSMFVGKVGGYGTIQAPSRLENEMAGLVTFKTSVLPPVGYRRYLRWRSVTAERSARSYGMFFGALAAAPLSPVEGLGVPLKKLTFGLFVFPAVWDWYLHWRERRRGFFTMSERAILYDAKGIIRDPTGWLRQHPELAKRLTPIEGLVSNADIAEACADWPSTCNKAYAYICDRIFEMLRVTRTHRDPYEAISPILNSASPLGEYKKIADEIRRLMPGENGSELDMAIAVRSYLLVRLVMQLGIRQRNLRELLLCIPGNTPRTVRQLEELERGEFRWNDSKQNWEVFIPAVAFKNGSSSFFKGRPLRLALSDLDGLYGFLDSYINRYRSVLLAGYPDPGTFFVRSARSSMRSGTYDMFSFYGTWKNVIQRYGIFNPYTGRGAIAGLLPHGPHCVRDVIATHVLKQTNSYELASFAIQDTVDAVVRHYSRFLPEEKAALAAEVLDKVWQANHWERLAAGTLPGQGHASIACKMAAIPNRQIATFSLTLMLIKTSRIRASFIRRWRCDEGVG
jgi:hypothetical protein